MSRHYSSGWAHATWLCCILVESELIFALIIFDFVCSKISLVSLALLAEVTVEVVPLILELTLELPVPLRQASFH